MKSKVFNEVIIYDKNNILIYYTHTGVNEYDLMCSMYPVGLLGGKNSVRIGKYCLEFGYYSSFWCPDVKVI